MERSIRDNIDLVLEYSQKGEHDKYDRGEIREVIEAMQDLSLQSDISGGRGNRLDSLISQFSQDIYHILSDENIVRDIKETIEDTEEDVSSAIEKAKKNDEIIESIQESLRIHLISFFRSTMFSTQRSIFDQRMNTYVPRQKYIVEFTTMFMETMILLDNTDDEDGKKTMKSVKEISRCHGPEFVYDFIYGNLIKKTLQAEGINLEEEKIKKIFNRRIRLELIANKNADPLNEVIRVAYDLTEYLSDEGIQEILQEEGIEMSQNQIQEYYLEWIRTVIAQKSRDTRTMIVLMAQNLTELLTDENIQETLEEHGISLTDEEIEMNFSISGRVHFALCNMNDPFFGIIKWINGDRTTPNGKFKFAA